MLKQTLLTDFKKRDLVPEIIPIQALPDSLIPIDHNLNSRLDRIESMVQAVLLNQKAGGAVTEGMGTVTIKERKIYTLRVEQEKTVKMIQGVDLGAELRETLKQKNIVE